jgi:hypothetical protein
MKNSVNKSIMGEDAIILIYRVVLMEVYVWPSPPGPYPYVGGQMQSNLEISKRQIP